MMPADRDNPLSRRYDPVPSDTAEVRRVMAALRRQHGQQDAGDYPDGERPPVPEEPS